MEWVADLSETIPSHICYYDEIGRSPSKVVNINFVTLGYAVFATAAVVDINFSTCYFGERGRSALDGRIIKREPQKLGRTGLCHLGRGPACRQNPYNKPSPHMY